MALGDRILKDQRHRITGTAATSISSSFVAGKHLDLQVFSGEAALLYKLEALEDEIEELRRYITNEATGSAVTLKDIDTTGIPTSTARLSRGDLYSNRGVITIF